MKQVKIKGGSGTIAKQNLITNAIAFYDFTVSMKDTVGKVGDMRFIRGSASIGDGGADGHGLRIHSPHDKVRTRFLASVKLPFTKTITSNHPFLSFTFSIYQRIKFISTLNNRNSSTTCII